MNPDLKKLLNEVEGESYEFKEAKNRFDIEELTKYACAFANRGGGKIVLGVTDKRPRQVVGTMAFDQPERIRAQLMDHLPIRIGLQVFREGEKQVLVFSIPSRPVGVPVKYKGQYWSRKGDSLVPMQEDELRQIFDEISHDFSADMCLKAQWEDLDSQSIEDFRRRWIAKSNNPKLATISQEQLLNDCEAVTREGITYAALILFGKYEALGRLLSQCEVVFEYRSTEASGPAQFRQEFRQGFFSYYDQLWEIINRRNDMQHFQDGFFIFDVPTFDDRTIREAILNAVSHRNYQYGSNIFIRQYPKKLVVESPGGLPHDVTLSNILERQSPRNRRLADIFAKGGLVERAGQGMNLMVEWCIKQAKSLPDLSKTDQHRVIVCLDGLVQNPQLLAMMQKIGNETLETFSTEDFLLLNEIQLEKPISAHLRDNVSRLCEMGILEKVGRGKCILSQKYYHFIGEKGKYTRMKGLYRESEKKLLEQHIKESGEEGSPLRELCQIFPGKSESQIRVLLRELKEEGKIISTGTTRAGKWFAID